MAELGEDNEARAGVFTRAINVLDSADGVVRIVQMPRPGWLVIPPPPSIDPERVAARGHGTAGDERLYGPLEDATDLSETLG